MRLHTLTLRAFGAFNEPVMVDFDRLNDGGLFLLSGDTGGGKTTILDAVCFALYGEVPGARSGAKQLKCDLAGADVRPEVGCELTVSGRRFRITRSPSYERPKKRGEGMMTEQAKVSLEERRDGAGGPEWHHHTSRIDEAADLIGSVLGMTRSQFTQVTMLPQGEFQTFLHSSSDERGTLLQKLFDTGRFADVERWLAAQRTEAGRRHEQALGRVSRTLVKASEASGREAPGEWDEPVASAVADGSTEAWLRSALESAREAASSRGHEHERRSDEESAAQDALDELAARAERHARFLSAAEERAALEAAAPAQNTRREALAAAARAERVAPLARAAERAHAQATSTLHGCRVHVAALRGVGIDIDAELNDVTAMTVAREQTRDARSAAAALLPRERARKEVADRMRVLMESVESAESEREDLSSALETLPVTVAELRTDVERARTLAGSTSHLADDVQRHRDVVAAHVRLTELAAALDQATVAQTTAQRVHLDAKERYLEIREQRIHNMAAELASQLAVGDDCPVCGSHEHPSKARGLSGDVTAAQEKVAAGVVEESSIDVQVCDDQVASLTAQISAAHSVVGDTTPYVAEQRLAEAEAAALTAAEAEARLPTIEADLADLQATLEETSSRHGSLGMQVASDRSMLVALTQEHDAIESEVAAFLDAHDGRTLEGLLETLSSREDVVTAAIDHAEALRSHRDDAAVREAEAQSVALDADFDSAEAALAACLDDQAREALDRDVRRHDDRLAIVDDVLADPTSASVLAEGPPDTAGAEVRLTEAKKARVDAHTAATRATSLVVRLSELTTEHSDAVASWRPAHEHLTVVTELAKLVEGKHTGVAARTSLSAYVLAYRFAQVVDAANERLRAMTDARFTLEHEEGRVAGERRSGLGLRVRDEWSDTVRETRTLSGGETFMVSLCLALGLADAVSHESGGIRLDTLFIDEGFGSLDADALESVMDVLDSLRTGGRVVGVVSHVPAMKEAIGTRVEVTKASGDDVSRGSTLRLVGP